MTSYRTTTIRCDEPECGVTITGPGPAKEVRLDCPYGWVWKYSEPHGGWVDLCPIHSQSKERSLPRHRENGKFAKRKVLA